MEIIPDLIEIGMDVLNPVQPKAMDLNNTVRNKSRTVCMERICFSVYCDAA
jgi:hypothetical protein